MRESVPSYFFRWYGAASVLVLAVLGAFPHSSLAGRLETANVMAPLNVEDWGAFENALSVVKQYGVDAVSVDVWWGRVEGNADNQFDWSYYDQLFSKVKSHGLKIVPIMSFHRCGGNVGDDCNIPLPGWLWNKYVGRSFKGFVVDNNDLMYKSEQGNFSTEVVQLWADELVMSEYTDFVNAFKSHFATYNNDVIEINVSGGSAGELRYPSYNSQDRNTGYPTRGALQSYSRLALQDFQTSMLKKYASLDGVNTAWGIQLTDPSEIRPPSDAEGFFNRGDYANIRYGKDFVDWYNQALVNHGFVLLTQVTQALAGAFPNAAMGYKIPGVHWAMTNPAYPRAAEVAAGLIQTSIDFTADATGHGYANIINLAQTLASNGRRVAIHFTCLEMDDQSFAPQYSLAKSLVFWVAQHAQRQGITIKGENALSGGITGNPGWDNIDNAFQYAAYTGLTALRIGEVASGLGQARYTNLIQKFRYVFRGYLNDSDQRRTGLVAVKSDVAGFLGTRPEFNRTSMQH